jgi:hypothetical protein
LDRAYYSTRLPVVRERLAVAAVRLAVTLEGIFGPQQSSSVAAGQTPPQLFQLPDSNGVGRE